MTAQQPPSILANNQFANNQEITGNPVNQPPINTQNTSVSLWIWLIIIFILIVIIGIIYFTFFPKNYITVEDQPLAKTVNIKNLSITKGGFVVIKTANRYTKPSNTNVAASEYLPKDTYEDITLDYYDIATRSDSINPEIQTIHPGSTLFALVYEDTDHNFQISTPDTILKDVFGKQLIAKFKLK